MSLPADIIQLVGTSSVPVVVAGTVLGVFELGEKLASQRAKDAFRHGFSHSTFGRQEHCLTERERFLNEFSVSVIRTNGLLRVTPMPGA